MIRKDKRTFADGSSKTYYRVTEGYRPKPGLPPKQRTVKAFGYIEDHENPENFLSDIQSFHDSYFKTKSLDSEEDSEMYTKYSRTYNYGYKFIENVYNQIGFDEFIKDWLDKHDSKHRFDLAKIFKFFVLNRIMIPASKRGTFSVKNLFYDFDCSFQLHDVYRALDLISEFDVELQKHCHTMITELTKRDISYAFYDVTNFYTEIDFNDETDEENNILGLRKKGVSKEHQLTPIIQFGMFMDSNGIPINMQIFPGNTSDSITFQPVLEKLKADFGTTRIIAVADKGMNSSKNIDYLINHGNGFVFSQILKGKKGQRYHKEAFSETGWITHGNDRHKVITEAYIGKDNDGNKVTRERKVLIYYNHKDAKMAKRKREVKLDKAERETKNNVYDIAKGADRYTKTELVSKETGEVMDGTNTTAIKSIDTKKAEEDAKFDGLFCIITSELDYTADKIRTVYSQLWKIEESFRIMKSDLETRPIHLSTQAHIQGHFTTCYSALVVVRLLQYYMGEDAITTERLKNVLNAAVCQVDRGGIVYCQDVGGQLAFEETKDLKGRKAHTLKLTNEDEIAKDYKKIQKAFHVDFFKSKTKIEKFNKFLEDISIVA